MPVPSQMRTDAAATSFSVRYSNARYIADRVFPVVRGITKDSGKVWKYNKDNLRSADESGPLAPKTPAPEVDWTPTSVTFELERFALMDLVLQDEIDNADEAFDPEMDAVMHLTDRLLVRREKKAATKLFTTGNWASSTTLSGTDQWSDDTSDILGAIQDAQDALFTQGNLHVMGAEVWSQVRHHPDVTQRFQYVSGGGVSVAQFASLFEDDAGQTPTILIGSAKEVTTEEDATPTTDTTARIWGKHYWVGYVDPDPGLRSMTACETLQRGESREVTEWANNNPKGVNKMVEDRFLHHIVATDLGYMIEDAVA